MNSNLGFGLRGIDVPLATTCSVLDAGSGRRTPPETTAIALD